MLGVKSTLSNLTKDLWEFISKYCLGGEEVILFLVEILLLVPSSLFGNWMVTFPLSSCMIKRGFLFWTGFGRAS